MNPLYKNNLFKKTCILLYKVTEVNSFLKEKSDPMSQ